jgi:large repetitive protein
LKNLLKQAIYINTQKNPMKLIYNRQLYSLVMAVLMTFLYLIPAVSNAGTRKSSAQATFSLPLTTCLSESFTDPTFPNTGWAAILAFRSTNPSNVNSAPAAAILPFPVGVLTTPELSYPQTMTVYIGRSNNSTPKTLNIQVSTTSQNSGFTTITSYNHSNIAAGSYDQYTIDLSAYNSNASVWVRFQKTSLVSFSPWRIDDVEVTCNTCAPPTIDTHPADVATCDSTNVDFNVTATGTTGLVYGWQESTDNGLTWNNLSDGGVYSGTATSTLTLTQVLGSMNGYLYRAAVSDDCGGPSYSDAASLTIETSPPTPGPISGPNYACIPQTGVVYSIAPVPTATSYLWYFDAGTTGASFVGPTNGTSVTVDFGPTPNSGYKLRVIAINACGNSEFSGLLIRNAISVPHISGPSTVCAGASGVFSVPTAVVGAVSYTWTAPAGATIDGNPSPYNTTNLSVTIVMPAGFTGGQVCVAAVDPCSVATAFRCMDVKTIPGKPNKVLGSNDACPGDTGAVYNIVAVANATSYTWTVPANVVITSGQGTTSITVDFLAGFTNGNICVTADNACGSSLPACIQVASTIPAMPTQILGDISGACGAGPFSYSVAANPNATSYDWTLPPGGTIISGAGTNSITVDFTGVVLPDQVCVAAVNACGSSAQKCVTVTAIPRRPGNISGPTNVCANSTGVAYSVAPVTGATSYTWILPLGATIASGSGTNSITVDWATTGGNINVIAVNACGQSPARTLTVTLDPAPQVPGPISGPAFACPPQSGIVYSIAPVPGAISYLWYFDSTSVGGTIVGPNNGTSITVDFGPTPFSGYRLRVISINACGNSAYSGLLIRNTISVPQLSGPDAVCAGQSGTYTIPNAVAGAVDYTWTAPAGALINGQPSPYTSNSLSVQIDFPVGFVSGQVCVAANDPCGTQTPQRCKTVRSTPAMPGAITGISPVCPGATGVSYSVALVPSATGYTWSVPAGATIASGQGTNQITVDFSGSFTAGAICVVSDNACGSSAPRCKNVVSGIPVMPGNIVGEKFGLCNATAVDYSVPAVNGATSYVWTLPAGANITAGAGTNNITVDFTGATLPGTICVAASNSCGNGASRCVPVTGVPQQPAAITGPVTVCANQTGIGYSVAPVFGAINYIWNVPTGAVITAGAGSNSITVDWGTSSGNVVVKAENACGQSGSKVLAVLVNCRVGAPSVIHTTLNVYPNPVADVLNVEYTLTSASSVTIELTDLSGKVVSKLIVNGTEGSNNHSLDLSGLAKGNYLMNLRSDSLNEVKRIVVQ